MNLSLTNNRTIATGNDFGLDGIVLYDMTAGMTLEKTGTLNDLNGNNLIDAGETITYQFLVTNTGPIPLTGVTVDDPLLGNAGISVTPGPQTLVPTESFTFTATYTPVQAEINAGSVANTAMAIGTPPIGPAIASLPDTAVVPAPPAALDLQKSGTFQDVNGDGRASVGDTLRYTLLIGNTGGRTVSAVSPVDLGPTFNGRPAEGSLSAFVPSPVTLAPGDTQSFTASYVLTQPDIDNGAGVAGGITNTASARGQASGVAVLSSPSTALLTIPIATSSDIGLTKIALLRQIQRSQEAPFAITITNNAVSMASGLRVVDTLPSGFRYVEGSATVGGVAVTPLLEGRQVIFENVDVPGNSTLEIRLRMLALSSAGPGEHTNRVGVTDSAGTPLAPEATATVEIMVEPVFDCSEIIGRVFDDANRNGYQDEGELGLPGVRLATVNGWLVTTDAHGRLHVACAAMPDQRIGSNFIMKLDPRTLPTGYRLTTENPLVVRLTAGKMTALDFGASIGRVVRLDLQGDAFEPGGVVLRPQWAQGIDRASRCAGAGTIGVAAELSRARRRSGAGAGVAAGNRRCDHGTMGAFRSG